MLVTKDDKIIVTQNPLGNLFYISISFIFTALCFVTLKYAEDIYFYHKFFMFIGLIFFGFGTLFLIFRTIINKNLIVVDKNGITDNTSAIALGFIEWEDILDIRLNAIDDEKTGGSFVTLILADEEKYLNRVSPMKKPMLLASIKMGYSIANISLNSTGVPIEEFYKKLIDYRNNL